MSTATKKNLLGQGLLTKEVKDLYVVPGNCETEVVNITLTHLKAAADGGVDADVTIYHYDQTSNAYILSKVRYRPDEWSGDTRPIMMAAGHAIKGVATTEDTISYTIEGVENKQDSNFK